MRGRKLNISLVFMSKSYFQVFKDITRNATNYFIIKMLNKRGELQLIASSHWSHIEFKGFVKLYKDYTKEPFSVLVNGTTLQSDNPLGFRKIYYKMIVREKIKTI